MLFLKVMLSVWVCLGLTNYLYLFSYIVVSLFFNKTHKLCIVEERSVRVPKMISVGCKQISFGFLQKEENCRRVWISYQKEEEEYGENKI